MILPVADRSKPLVLNRVNSISVLYFQVELLAMVDQTSDSSSTIIVTSLISSSHLTCSGSLVPSSIIIILHVEFDSNYGSQQ